MNVATLMTSNPERIGVREPISHAVEKLFELDVRHLPVVDDSGELVGIVSDRDLRSHSLPLSLEFQEYGAEGEGGDEERMSEPVSQIMRSDVQYVDRETDVFEVIDLMLDFKIGAVPVVDPLDGRLVGIVSYIDILREAQDHFL